MNLVDRVKNMLLQPKAEWETIAGETTGTAELYQTYAMPLAAIGPLASVIGMTIVGITIPFIGTYRVPLMNALAGAITSFALTLAGIFLVSLIIDALAPNFGGEKNPAQALKVAVYSSTPSFLAGIFQIVPVLGLLGLLLALYGLYLLYLGLPILMKVPREKAAGFTVLVVVAAIVVGIVVGAVGGLFLPTMPGPGFGIR